MAKVAEVIIEPQGAPRKRIKIACKAAITLRLDQLVPFQGELKSLSEESFEKLKKSLLKYGVTFPFLVWHEGADYNIIDGTQRERVLSALQDDGYIIPPLPAVLIDAANATEAREKILLASSQNGEITEESLYQFIHQNKIDWPEIASMVDFRVFGVDKFSDGWMKQEPLDPSAESGDGKEHECPNCGHVFRD